MLTRTESSALRGIAILGIVLHNYTHWLGPMVKENEYTFTEHNVRRFMMELSVPGADTIAQLFSFFGHYGVPIFLFLSAYGLVMKYESRAGETIEESAWRFVKSHYTKLFQMMIVGYAAFVMVDYMTPGPRKYELWNVIGELGMFSNLYADPDRAIWPGPYWYFGLMVQIYLLYRFVLYRGKGSISGLLSENGARMLLLFLVGVSVGVQVCLDPEGPELNWYRYNVFGSILPFAMGLIYARAVKSEGKEKSLFYALEVNSNLSTKIGVCLLLMFLIMIGSMYFYTWSFVPALVCMLAVIGVKCLPKVALEKFAWVGAISAAMFVSHPIARKVIIPISRHGELYAGLILYLISAIILGIVFTHLIRICKSKI